MEVAVAGAAVGATIQVVMENLLSFPVEEISQLWNFKEDLQKLKTSVTTILDFLEDAEMKQVTDKPVNRWLLKLDALAFDADYVFDQLNYQILRKKVETDNKMKKLQVSSSLFASIPFVFRHKMAKEIKNINKSLELINREANELGLQMRIAGPLARGAGTEAPAYWETDSLSEDPVFVGRENEVTKMVEMLTGSLTDQQVLSVFPIVGMGGLGKTTLARKVHNHRKIISHFGERMWVHVRENFDPVAVLKKTLESLTGEKVDASREVVLRKLQEKVGDKRYILVLDNVWNEETDKWDNFVTSLKGISRVKGNVILVTTRSGNVGSISKTLDVHELGGLTDDDCWLIIKAKAFGGEGIPSEFETIGKYIAKKCGGLPLAAKVVGSLLRGKLKDEWVSTKNKWLSYFEGDGDIVSKSLKLSYDNLSSPSLKKCFAFCSIIPKGWLMEKDELIHLWMAEGLLQTDQENDMEIVGNRVFDILVHSSLLQVWQRDCYGHVKQCILHDLVHDFALSVSNPKLPDNTYHRHLTIPCMEESRPFPEMHTKCLRALCFSGKVSHNMFSNMKRLHVLILIDENIEELPIEIGKLISLRYLDISETRMECLPESIGDLYHLQTLNATNAFVGTGYLKKLPHTFQLLISLRHLYIPNISLPPHIGKLISLQTLPYFRVGEEEGCGIKELGSLKNLKGEIEIDNLEKVRDKEDANSADLFHKPNIFKLKLVWNIESEEGESNHENVLEGLQPHPNLKSLEVHGFKGRGFPLWTLRMEVREDLKSPWVRLENLMEIKLSSCEECEEIPMLGHLPHLKWLFLHDLSNVKYLGSSFYGIEANAACKETFVVFPVLEKLELIGMPNLTAWDEVGMPSSFCRLMYLKITKCRQLMRAPSDFPCLRELEINNMESELPLVNICGSKITSLTKVIIRKVDGLECLPISFFDNNRDLLELKMEECNNLTHLPCLGGGGASLRKLVIRRCLKFKEFLEDLHILNALEELTIRSCPNLKSIAYYPSSGGGQLSSQGGLTSLRKLDIYWCRSVTNLPIQMIESCTLSLETLFLPGAESITNLPHLMSILAKMPRLIDLEILKTPKFSDVAAKIGSLGSLQYLGIGGSSDCRDYVSFKASLDLIFPTLQSLSSLSLWGMEQWDALPDQLQHLTTLKYLYLHEFGIEALPEWLGNLSSLNILGLYKCQKIRHFPSKKAMQGLTKLNQIEIVNCPLLKQNLEKDSAVASDDSEWSKISHIPTINLDRQPFSDVLVFDILEGLVTGAVAERLGGMGYVCNPYCGTTPYPVSIVRMFNLSDETCKRIVHARLTELQPSNSGNSTSTDQLVDACNITEQKNENTVSPSPAIDLANMEESSSGNMETDNTALPKSGNSVKAGKSENAHREVIKSWKENGFSSLIITAPNMDAWDIAKELVPLLSYSAPFVIYHQYLKPLATCMHNLQSKKMAINLQISEPWLREYQVLPSRTHPHMQMSSSGGYLLSGTRISSNDQAPLNTNL